MKLQVLKLSILFTLFNFSALSAPTCDGQGKIEPALSVELKSDLNVLQVATESITIKEMKACIENIYDLEKTIRRRANLVEVLDWYKTVLYSHKKQKEVIRDRINYFKDECEYDGKCRTVNYHISKLKEEYKKENETKVEAMEYVSEAVDLKRKEAALRKSFDVDCQEQKYDKELVIKECRENYSYESPICRDYM